MYCYIQLTFAVPDFESSLPLVGYMLFSINIILTLFLYLAKPLSYSLQSRQHHPSQSQVLCVPVNRCKTIHAKMIG